MTQRKDVDLLIVAVPLVYPICPPVGPAIIKALLQKNGWSCDVWDLNMELFQIPQLKGIFESSNEVFSFYPTVKNTHEKFLSFYQEHLEDVNRQWAQKIVELSPKKLGLSLFSSHSAYMGERLILEVRKLRQDMPIVIGGPYAQTLMNSAEDRAFFPENIDIIAGEGERSILKYMEGDRSYPGINSMPVQLDDMSLIPIPEYEPGQFDPYDQIDGVKRVYITTSRGCVRRCTFCDIKTHWPKYRYRSAQDVFNEMVYLNEKFGRQNFKFTDSLINGNTKMLAELCRMLIDSGKKFTWGGQFICRNQQFASPEFFQLLADAGCTYLSIGIESGSEKVRNDMRKHFSNEDIFYNFHHLSRVGIKTTMLMIIGYITEGEKEFQETLEFFDECKRRGFFMNPGSAEGCVERINLGFTLAVAQDAEAYDILMSMNPSSEYGYNWVCGDNDRRTRLERLFLSISHLYEIGYGHLNQSQIGAVYASLWEEFQTYQQFGKVNPDFIGSLTSEFINR